MVNEFFTAQGAIDYIVYRNGNAMNSVREFYHDTFKKAFKRMFPNFRIIDETDSKIEAPCPCPTESGQRLNPHDH